MRMSSSGSLLPGKHRPNKTTETPDFLQKSGVLRLARRLPCKQMHCAKRVSHEGPAICT